MRWLIALVALLALAEPMSAQVRPNPERLREQVVARFIENFRNQAGLTDDQFTRFQTVTRRSWQTRRELEQRQRQVLQAMEQQMRPGVAADPDSVTTLIDALLEIQEGQVARARADQEDYAAFLDPVQRAQLVLSFTRLERQIEQIVRRRMQQQGR